MRFKRKKLMNLKGEINSLRDSIKDAEDAIKNVKLEAESIIPKKLTADERFMAQYNMMNNFRN